MNSHISYGKIWRDEKTDKAAGSQGTAQLPQENI